MEGSRAIQGRAALALPTLGLVVGVLDTDMGVPVVGGRDLGGFAGRATVALVLAPRRARPDLAHSHLIPIFFFLFLFTAPDLLRSV